MFVRWPIMTCATPLPMIVDRAKQRHTSRSMMLRRPCGPGLVDAAAGGGLEHKNLLPDSRCLNVA
jgi:hypothetical protein